MSLTPTYSHLYIIVRLAIVYAHSDCIVCMSSTPCLVSTSTRWIWQSFPNNHLINSARVAPAKKLLAEFHLVQLAQSISVRLVAVYKLCMNSIGTVSFVYSLHPCIHIFIYGTIVAWFELIMPRATIQNIAEGQCEHATAKWWTCRLGSTMAIFSAYACG